MHTIVELPEYLRKAEQLLSAQERSGILTYLALHPTAGNLITGTGGIRKLRWAAHGKGKSGRVRIIYFLYKESMPLFLLTAFSKSDKDNLSMAERNDLARLTSRLIKSYGN